jgi:hypothetical protein
MLTRMPSWRSLCGCPAGARCRARGDGHRGWRRCARAMQGTPGSEVGCVRHVSSVRTKRRWHPRQGLIGEPSAARPKAGGRRSTPAEQGREGTRWGRWLGDARCYQESVGGHGGSRARWRLESLPKRGGRSKVSTKLTVIRGTRARFLGRGWSWRRRGVGRGLGLAGEGQSRRGAGELRAVAGDGVFPVSPFRGDEKRGGRET